MNKGEIIIYQTPDGITSLDVRLEEDTVWLTQAQMVELFGRDRTVITKHINNIFKEKELDEKSNVHFLHTANSDKPIKLYNLEMAKIGHLVLNKGLWNGQQIADSVWLDEMTSTKVSADKVDYYGKTFGYYWWIDESRGMVFMNGHGGQFVFIKPSKNLVVVATAEPNTQGKHEFLLPKALDIFDRIDKIATP
jgi:hypothetical protein